MQPDDLFGSDPGIGYMTPDQMAASERVHMDVLNVLEHTQVLIRNIIKAGWPDDRHSLGTRVQAQVLRAWDHDTVVALLSVAVVELYRLGWDRHASPSEGPADPFPGHDVTREDTDGH